MEAVGKQTQFAERKRSNDYVKKSQYYSSGYCDTNLATVVGLIPMIQC